ncbi:MAG: sulfotransferase domain-containing protein [Reyranella sp.]|nr:sulfotransferase domain-containing protein [Reyranella sp.]
MSLPLVLSKPFRHERGYCWRVRLPDEMRWATDHRERPQICPLSLFEADRMLGPGHSSHAEIATLGAGRYSVWSDGWLYFSAPDNGDPNTHDRPYTLDLSTAAPQQIQDQAGPVIQEVIRSVRALPPEFKPQQAMSALKRGLDLLNPDRVLSFNAEVLSREFADLDMVAERYVGYRSELAKCDAVFLSIYCAGRTWVRFFLQCYLEAACQVEISLAPRSIPRTRLSPSLCFTHDFLDLYETIAEEPWIVFESFLLERPLILMTRDLRDLAVSSFYYLRSSQPKAFASLVHSGALTEYINSPIVGIERLAQLFVLEKEFFERHQGPKLHLAYERLHASPATEFRRLLEFLLSAPIEESHFEHALRLSSFSEMQALEIRISRSGSAKEHMRLGVDNWSGDKNDLKVRSGKVGRFRQLLPGLADRRELSDRYPLTARARRFSNGGPCFTFLMERRRAGRSRSGWCGNGFVRRSLRACRRSRSFPPPPGHPPIRYSSPCLFSSGIW